VWPHELRVDEVFSYDRNRINEGVLMVFMALAVEEIGRNEGEGNDKNSNQGNLDIER
jgi:hypothetical protein